MLLDKFRKTNNKLVNPYRNPNFFRCNWENNPKTLSLTEIIPASNYDIIHGRFITDYAIDINDLRIDAHKPKGVIMSSDFQCYINREYFNDDYDRKTKKAVEFSLKLDRSSYDCIFKIVQLSNNTQLEDSYTLSNKEYYELINEAERRFPSDWTIFDYGNIEFEEHRSTKSILESQKKTNFVKKPKYSIVVPLFNTPIDLFDEMVQSVLRQSYENFELILINASPHNDKLKERLCWFAKKDERIKEVTLAENLGIMKNTRKGIEKSTGDYVCFFDHDDMLEHDILFHYTLAINESEDEVGLLYCDEDKIEETGELNEAFLKGDFSIDALINRNYICHLLTIRKDILEHLDYNTDKYDGAQDHNLTLQAYLAGKKIIHINRTLYHWRKAPNSTAADVSNKEYATDAGILAVNDFLKASGIDATAHKSRRPFTYALEYPIKDNISVHAIINTTDTIRNLKTTISTINTLYEFENIEITLAGYRHNNQAIVKARNDREPIETQDVNSCVNVYEIINNLAQNSKHDYLLFLDSNVEINSKGDIEKLLGRAQRKDIGAVSPLIEYSDGTIFSAGIAVNLPKPNHINRGHANNQIGYMAFSDSELNRSAISGKCMVMSKKKFIESGGFSTDYISNYTDIDLCLRLRRCNNLILFTPETRVKYYGEFMIDSVKNNEHMLTELKDRLTLINNWEAQFKKSDPYTNKNLGNNNNNAFYCLPRCYRKQ